MIENVSLGNILKLERRRVNLDPDTLYTEIGVRSFGKGIFHKEPRTGLEVGDKDLYQVQEGDFILQITFAWEGAVGLASKQEDGMYCSTRFPTFRVNTAICEPKYLLFYFKTPDGVAQLGNISPGSAGRNRVLSVKRIPEVFVPLPPLDEQRRIIAHIEALAVRIAEARGLRQGAVAEAEALLTATKKALFNDTFFNNFPAFALGNIAEIQSGVTLGRELSGETITLPYLRVANVQDGYFDLAEIKEVSIRTSEFDKWQLEIGDILLTEGGDWDKLGRGAVWQGEISNCIHQNHIFRVRVNPQIFNPYYLMALISSPYGKQYFQNASKQTTNLASINQRQLKAFQVVQPQLEDQYQIVEYLHHIQMRIITLKRLQVETTAELDALLSSVLDRAFKGELWGQ
ncbi:MAG: restriction endonuclease subunit S [Anaerolineae bacterium]|nr:restriction endonuclease subunit S [Anaerolineae bacterium]